MDEKQRHASQNARVEKLLASIAESRSDFLREILSRQRLLGILHERIEAQPPQDPIIAGIEESWKRLSSQYHNELRLRRLRSFGAPPKRPRLKMVVFEPSDGDWRNDWQFQRGRGGLIPLSNAHNILLALRESPALSGLIATDLATGKIMLKSFLPFQNDPTFDEGVDFEMRPLLVADVTAIREYLQYIGLSKVSAADVGSCIRIVAAENAWRPLDV